MTKIPGLKADIGFGGANKALPNWRKSKAIASEIDPDDEQIETPPDVVAVLGFDPAKDETMTTIQPNPGLRAALMKRMKGAKNGGANFTPQAWQMDPGSLKTSHVQLWDHNGGFIGKIPLEHARKHVSQGHAFVISEQAIGQHKSKVQNASQLAMFSPSPCISAYGAGKQQRVARNSGTGEMAAFHKASKASVLAHEASTPVEGAPFGPKEHAHAATLHEVAVKKIGRLSGTFQPHPGLKTDYGHWKSSHESAAKFHRSKAGASNTHPAAQADTLRERLVRRLAKSKRPKPLPGQKPAMTGHGWSQQNWWDVKGGAKV